MGNIEVMLLSPGDMVRGEKGSEMNKLTNIPEIILPSLTKYPAPRAFFMLGSRVLTSPGVLRIYLAFLGRNPELKCD